MSSERPLAGHAVATTDHVVKANNLGKRYEMYDRPHQRLLQTLFRGRRTFYREFWALRGVDLEVRRGQSIGVIGRNGSGKSTLLQLVAGTLFASEGSVETHGRIAPLLELGSGFNPDFTGRENAYLNNAILGHSRRETDDSFRAIEAFADIGSFIDQPVSTYSSGMTMRLAFAVAVHSTPDLLIVDEAMAVGDAAFQSKCLARIREMQDLGVAMLLVSHSPNVILEFCSDAIYLERGVIAAVGDSRSVLQQYTDEVVMSEGGRAGSLPQKTTGRKPVRSEAEATQGQGSAATPAEIVAVSITDAAGVEREVFEHGATIMVAVEVVFNEDNPAPCLGIQLRTTEDIALWATTTQHLHAGLEPRAQGSRARYEWTLRANLGGNRYMVSLGVGTVVAGVYKRYARVRYAGHFDVLVESVGETGWFALEPSIRYENAVSGVRR